MEHTKIWNYHNKKKEAADLLKSKVYDDDFENNGWAKILSEVSLNENGNIGFL